MIETAVQKCADNANGLSQSLSLGLSEAYASLGAAAESSGLFNVANVTSLVITAVLIVGLVLRHNRRLHPPIMVGCFLGDLGLVVFLEVSRSAIDTATSSLSPLMITHIALSTAMLVLYAALTVTGVRILRSPVGDASDATLARLMKHRVMAVLFLLVRVGVLATALMVAGDVSGSKPRAGDEGDTGGAKTGSDAAINPAPKKADGVTLP